MTTPMSDDDLDQFTLAVEYLATREHAVMRDTGFMQSLLARLAKAEAERDVAVKEVARMTAYYYSPTGDNHHNALKCPHCRPGYDAEREADMLEGERRATAAIVAYLGNEAADYPGTDYGQWVARIADAIERGDHLTEAKPPQN